MAPIVASVEIARVPADVFAYVTDPSRLPQWQESVVRVAEHQGPVAVGARVPVTRKAGPREVTMTAEIAELDPPRSWAIRGVDGPVRGNAKGRVEPVDGGDRSRVTIELDLQGHGIGKLLVPLFVKRQAERELPANMQRLKERLEATR